MLCALALTQVRFDDEAASELHKSLYRAKMQSLIAKGRLSAADQADLKRIRHILCVPDELATMAQVRGASIVNTWCRPVCSVAVNLKGRQRWCSWHDALSLQLFLYSPSLVERF